MTPRHDAPRPIRVVVTGGRNFDREDVVFAALDRLHEKTPIVALAEGSAPGADYYAAKWAENHDIQHAVFPARWRTDGIKAAGPIRNTRMLHDFKPDVVVAFPGGRGTMDCVGKAKMFGIPVLVIEVPR